MNRPDAETKARLFAAARLLAAAAVIALTVLGFLKQKTRISETPFETVKAAVAAAAALPETQPGDAQMLRRLYGLDPALFEEFVLLYPDTNMGANEMLLAKLKDPADRETVRAAAAARVQAQIGVFEGYAPAQTALLKTHAEIAAPGNYFLLIVDENAAAALAAFNEVT